MCALFAAPEPRTDSPVPGGWHCQLTVHMQRWAGADMTTGAVCMRELIVSGESSLFDLAQVIAASFGIYDADFEHTNGEGEKVRWPI